ncbi:MULTISPECIES: fimbrillin family protein [Prevotellaceae]|uniref:fimbrillin family protein n=1 Tax=Prevotellaceae TaxID=171552 RepID=UPI000413FEDC|nr:MULTISPECIES: fimbrillin family protein [Prevotellaceae]
MKKDLFKAKSLATLCCFMLAFMSCANEDVAQKTTDTDSDNDKNLTTFSAGAPESRTTMDYSTGNFYWEAGDYIYVKDDNNVWRKSKNTPTAKTTFFNFKVDGDFNNSATYKVYYPGKNGTNNQVTIPAAQTQTVPNTTIHFGESGDCGTADATGTIGGKAFSFKLDHQAAYLVFQPYTTNKVLHDCYLTKIEVNSDNDITDTYTLDPTTGELTGTGSGQQIVLTTKGSGAYAEGFPLTNTSADITTNGACMIIKPGTHTLRIRYWVKGITENHRDIEGTVTKTLSSHFFAKNKYYNMIFNLNPRDYDGSHYYMWDAQQQYWFGHEWNKGGDQPTTDRISSNNYPQNNSDPRYYNETVPDDGMGYEAQTVLFKSLPNVNELSWYVMKGDPRWDKDELWTSMGLLYKGGMWFLKKANIIDYSTEHSFYGIIDLRTFDADQRTRRKYRYFKNTPSDVLPSATDANKYFYLPALGSYLRGGLGAVGSCGRYWTSSARPVQRSLEAYSLYIDRNLAQVRSLERCHGRIAQPFSDFGDE